MTRRSVAIAIAGLAILALVALAQTAQIEGTVLGEDGQPLQGAVVKFVRSDVKQTLSNVKTDKKGHFLYMGLPPGSQWVISVEVGGKEVGSQNTRASLASPANLKFDLGQIKRERDAQTEAMKKLVEGGDINAATKGMSSEQRQQLEELQKQNEAALRKNKDLSDAYSGAMTALQASNFADAIAGFEKASALDPKQIAVWLGMADAYMGSFKAKKGDERAADVQKCLDAYAKALELKPEEAGIHNNLGRALAEAGKFPEAQAEMNKAAQIDPPGAGKYFYNLGAILVNIGQADAAAEAFKKAFDADPNYGDAVYQYGVSLMAKAQVAADGTVTPAPGTVEAFQKCVDLGAEKCKFSQQAKDMMEALHAKVETTYRDPNAKKTTTKKK